MDFRQTVQPNTRTGAASTPAPAVTSAHDDHKHGDGMHPYHVPVINKWMKILTVSLLAGVVILLAAIAYGVGHSGTDNEFSFVDKSKYQAVFLNSGQVYFGNVTALNSQYIHMSNIYYLTQASGSDSSSSNSSNNYSLVKLGCQQIHDPYDAMVINRSEVSFWENLQDNGKVVSSINQFKQQNPNGPNCSQVSNQTQADSSATQGSNTNPANTNNTNSTSNTTTK